METKVKMTDEEFFRQLEEEILNGITHADPILERFSGSPERAAALFAGEVMEADHASAEDLSSMRFTG